jgi:hypothetical protein
MQYSMSTTKGAINANERSSKSPNPFFHGLLRALPTRNSPGKRKILTSFLSLPRELRHTILLSTYDPTDAIEALNRCDTSTGPYKHHSIHCQWFSTWRDSGDVFKQWAETLRKVDDRLVEDVDYVEMKWKEHHLALLKAWKKGMGNDLNLIIKSNGCFGLKEGKEAGSG